MPAVCPGSDLAGDGGGEGPGSLEVEGKKGI